MGRGGRVGGLEGRYHLKLLKPLAKLTYLSLDDTALDDEACDVLAGYKNLDGLNLERTKITGKGLSKLLALKKLNWLGVAYTALTDADVPTLIQFPKGNIFAHGTKITAKGKRQIADSGCSWITA